VNGLRTIAGRCVLGVLALLGGWSVTGCTELVETTPPVHQPATLEEVEGSDLLHVTFDQEAAERVSLETATVRRTKRGASFPYAALIYDSVGVTWVYTSTGQLTFVREPVVVDRVENDKVWASKGPLPGTEVATTGATEVYGAELDIAGAH
jgi:hypothetical protein